MPQLLGAKLRRLRQQHGITQVEVAQLLGLVSYTHITKVEAGQDSPSLALVVRIAQVLNVTTDYLLRDSVPIEADPFSQVRGDTLQPVSAVFGKRLKALRLQRGITQAELARHLGLARQAYVSNLEAGRKLPSLDLCVQIADYFGVPTDYLLRDDHRVDDVQGPPI